MSILQYLQESLSSKIIAYHGSGSTFDTFNNLKDGIWFTDNKDVAIEYTDPSYTAKNDRILYTVELSPKKPLIIDAEGRDFEGIIYPPMYMDTEWDSEYTDEDEAKAEALEWEFSTDSIYKWGISKGYDTVIFRNIDDAPLQGSHTEESTIYGVKSNDIVTILKKENY